jgi:S-adenosyl-L-methionine methyltransferase
MTAKISRLEKLLFRLEAQHACLAWAFKQIEVQPGIVFEMGLGHGRTYDHLRKHMPGREIYVFERKVDSYPDCTPPGSHTILGEISETLPKAAERFKGQVILAHSDVGSFEAEHNARMSGIVSKNLAPALAKGALIMSDLPLEVPGTARLPLPQGAREERYYVYRYTAD